MTGKYDKYVMRQRIQFDLHTSLYNLSKLLDRLPEEKEVYKMISPPGGWSSCSLVMWIAKKCSIDNLIITTLRVGQKELEAVVDLKRRGKIKNICFYLSGLQKQNRVAGKDYRYSQTFEEVCDRAGIEYHYVHNHSKIILLNTDNGKFVIETSSNFNENPKMEQFSFEKSAELYDFYFGIIKELLGKG